MASELLLFIGTLNRDAPYFQGARGSGLCVYRFDEATAQARKCAEYPQVENPTYLSVTPEGQHVYANSEVFGWKEGLVTAFAFDPQTDALRYINTQPTLGSITAHNALSKDGRRLYVVNYTVGEGGPDQSLAVFDRRADGGLAPVLASVAHHGSGPNTDRQERAHAHSVTEMGNGLVIVADLGTDRLVTYRVGENGAPEKLADNPVTPGSGPRHLACHPNGRFIFVINELGSTVSAHAFDAGTGAITPIDAQPAVPAEARAQNHCSDIQIAPDGRFVYAANRGHDSIASFAVDPATGCLTAIGHTPCGGATPRNLALTPSGRYLLSANQNADRVSIFARDAASGQLTDTGQSIAIGTPMCLKFAG